MFDGHAGVEAATYAKCHLLSNIVRHPLFIKDVAKAIGEGIVVTDKNFCTKAEEEVRTYTVVYVFLYILWLYILKNASCIYVKTSCCLL